MSEKKRRIADDEPPKIFVWSALPEPLTRTISAFGAGADASTITQLCKSFSQALTLDRLVLPDSYSQEHTLHAAETAVASLDKHKALAWLKGITILRTYTLRAPVTDGLVDLFRQLHNVESVVFHCDGFTEQHWRRLFEMWPKLRSIRLEARAEGLTELMKALVATPPVALRALDIYCRDAVLDQLIKTPVTWLGQLTSLQLFHDEPIEPAKLARLLRACPSLETLSLRNYLPSDPDWWKQTFGDAKNPCCPKVAFLQLDSDWPAALWWLPQSMQQLVSVEALGIRAPMKTLMEIMRTSTATIEKLDVTLDYHEGIDVKFFEQTARLAPKLRILKPLERATYVDGVFPARLLLDWFHGHPNVFASNNGGTTSAWNNIFRAYRLTVTEADAKEFGAVCAKASLVDPQAFNGFRFEALASPGVFWSSLLSCLAEAKMSPEVRIECSVAPGGGNVLDDAVIEHVMSELKDKPPTLERITVKGDVGALSVQGLTRLMEWARKLSLTSTSDTAILFESKTTKAATATERTRSVDVSGNISAFTGQGLRVLGGYRQLKDLTLSITAKFMKSTRLDININAMYQWATKTTAKLRIYAIANVGKLELERLRKDLAGRNFGGAFPEVGTYDPESSIPPWQRAIDDESAWG